MAVFGEHNARHAFRGGHINSTVAIYTGTPDRNARRIVSLIVGSPARAVAQRKLCACDQQDPAIRHFSNVSGRNLEA
jgi:hypothetical protein